MKIVDQNNLKVFKTLTINNPTIIDFDHNDSHYYGLSSTSVDSRNDDSMIGKDVITTIDPFNHSSEWSFINNIKFGTLIVKSDESFKFLCTTGRDIIILKGSFINSDYFEYSREQLPLYQEIYQINYDEFENKISIIINDEIKIYDAINFIECDVLLLTDSIKLNAIPSESLKWSIKKTFSEIIGKFGLLFYNKNTNSTEYMKFGNNYRTSIQDGSLHLWNKYSFDLVTSITLESLGIVGEVLGIAIREIDDFVAILHKDDEMKITFFDPIDVKNTTIQHNILEFVDSSNYKISFSGYDSNIFHITSKQQSQIRTVSNPAYPVGQMRESCLKYPKKYLFGNTLQKFGNSNIKWNTNTLESNIFTNYLFETSTKNGKNYIFMLNSGRIYPIKQNISTLYQSAVPLNMEKYFNGINCSDSSFGLFFNRNIASALKDILNLYTTAANTFIIDKNDVVLGAINTITYDINNLYMNGNENVNVLTLQRVFNLLVDIQKKIVANNNPQP